MGCGFSWKKPSVLFLILLLNHCKYIVFYRTDNSLNLISSCLYVDPLKRPSTEELLKFSLFGHDNFNVWFLQELQLKLQVKVLERNFCTRRFLWFKTVSCLQEEFTTNPLLKTRKNIPSASKIKSAAEEILNKRNNEKSAQVNTRIKSKSWI